MAVKSGEAFVLSSMIFGLNPNTSEKQVVCMTANLELTVRKFFSFCPRINACIIETVRTILDQDTCNWNEGTKVLEIDD